MITTTLTVEYSSANLHLPNQLFLPISGNTPALSDDYKHYYFH